MLTLLVSAAGLAAQNTRGAAAGQLAGRSQKSSPPPPGIHFSASALGGVMYGAGIELVYGAPSGADYLSRLDWDMKPLYYYGFVLRVLFETPHPAWRPFVAFTFKNGLTGNTGFLEDRDWLDQIHRELTHFSRHDNFTRYALFLDLNFGTQFRPWKTGESLRFNFYFTFSWMNLMWESRDGYIQYSPGSNSTPPAYPPWDPSLPAIPNTGAAINYSQTWFIAAPAVGVEFPFLRTFVLEAAVAAGPLNFCVGDDYHIKRNMRFHDSSRWGIYFKPAVKFRFSPVRQLTFSVHGAWTLLTGVWGSSRTSTGDSNSWQDQGMTGAGLDLWEAGVSVSFNP
ncbi:MAG: omptin family outer membrane protease [Spirochaetaceae bacterium]|jgi:outer membrane protease|nr:omptin family outer membrane protease [Spirochaetaceae bacterium]